jgi:hypothetical protein
MMKTVLTAGLLAVVTNLAVAGPVASGGTHTSLSAFERGDPDEMVTAGYQYSGGHVGPSGPTVTSLAQFEQGDPDEMANAGYHYSGERHVASGPTLTSLMQFEQGDPDTTPGG